MYKKVGKSSKILNKQVRINSKHKYVVFKIQMYKKHNFCDIKTKFQAI